MVQCLILVKDSKLPRDRFREYSHGGIHNHHQQKFLYMMSFQHFPSS